MGPNYEPNSFGGPQPDPKYADPAIPINVTGPGMRYENHYGKDDFMHVSHQHMSFYVVERSRTF